MDITRKMKKWISINDSYQLSYRTLIATLISGVVAYHLLIIHGFTNPDGICEGLTFYKNGDWALAGCGRWAIRYMNEMTCNIVIPLYVVAMYSICIWLSIILLSKIWEFSNTTVIVISIIMITAPAVSGQLAYTYTALAYAYSCLLAVLFVYLVFRCSWKVGMSGGILCVAIMLGLYQSYVGMVAALVFMTVILDLLDDKQIKIIVIRFVVCVVSALLGCFFYSKILEWDIIRRGLDNSGTRVAEFNIEEIVASFFDRINYVYMKYSAFIEDKLMHRNIIYKGMIVCTVVMLICGIYKLIKKRKLQGVYRSIVAIALFALIPVASNIIGVLVPYNGISKIMQYQNVLLVPFMFACIHMFGENKYQWIIKYVAILMGVFLMWTYILASNATFKSYELSYNHINLQMQIAVTRVYDLEDYIKDETPILIAGFPNDGVLKGNLDIYQYAENFCVNPVFWLDMHGATHNRYLYFMNYFGIDAQRFSDDEYAAIVNSSQFAEMPVWPDKGSVAMIDGFAVVKFTEEPPMP